jgi:DNA-binding response OmpR family regulator
MKILLVEDNQDMRDLLALRVQLTGYVRFSQATVEGA